MNIESIIQMENDLERKKVSIVNELVDSMSETFSEGSIRDFRVYVNQYVNKVGLAEEMAARVRWEVDRRIESVQIKGLPNPKG